MRKTVKSLGVSEVGLLLPCQGQMAVCLRMGARASVDWYSVLSLVIQALPGDRHHPEGLVLLL